MNLLLLTSFGAAAFIVVALFLYLLLKTSRLSASANQLKSELAQLHQINGHLDQHIRNLEGKLEKANESIETLHRLTQGLPEQIVALEGQLRDQVQQDPQIKLYQKAASMAQEGATAEDIALACELPVAEASVLVSLHSRK